MSDNAFEQFWSLFPRKVAKRAAAKEWDKEIRAGTDPSEIIAGLQRQLPTLARKEAQFIPHARTWLHQGRWEDEPETIQRHPGKRSYLDAAMDRMRNDNGSAGISASGDDVERFSIRH